MLFNHRLILYLSPLLTLDLQGLIRKLLKELYLKMKVRFDNELNVFKDGMSVFKGKKMFSYISQGRVKRISYIKDKGLYINVL